MLSVNDYNYPPPVSYRLELEPVGSFERNANGELVGDLVAVKRKLSCGFSMLADEDFQQLLAAVREYLVAVEFENPETGESVSCDMYISLKGGSMALRSGGVSYWSGVTCEFTEK